MDLPITLSSSLVTACCSRASANSRLSLIFSFFASTLAGARVRVVGALRALGSLRTIFPRFAIEVGSEPESR